MIREEFENMQWYDGCPACGSAETYESVASIDNRDGVEVAICDDCGHVEEKWEA